MDMDVFDIIARKRYSELSEDERRMVEDVCTSEEEYFHMQQVLEEVGEMAKRNVVQPRPETKERLDALFAAQSFPKAAPVWYNHVWTVMYPREKKFYRRPLVQVAAIALLLITILPLTWNYSGLPDKQQLAVNEQPEMNDQQNVSVITEKEAKETLEVSEDKKMEYDATEQPVLLAEQRGDSVRFEGTFKRDVADRKMLTATRSEVGMDLKDAEVSSAANNGGLGFSAFMSSGAEENSGKIDSDHPDGVFNPDLFKKQPTHSIVASEKPAVLDLLTATF